MTEDTQQADEVQRLPVETVETPEGCLEHPGVVCWHMVVYGGYHRRQQGQKLVVRRKSVGSPGP